MDKERIHFEGQYMENSLFYPNYEDEIDAYELKEGRGMLDWIEIAYLVATAVIWLTVACFAGMSIYMSIMSTVGNAILYANYALLFGMFGLLARGRK